MELNKTIIKFMLNDYGPAASWVERGAYHIPLTVFVFLVFLKLNNDSMQVRLSLCGDTSGHGGIHSFGLNQLNK